MFERTGEPRNCAPPTIEERRSSTIATCDSHANCAKVERAEISPSPTANTPPSAPFVHSQDKTMQHTCDASEPATRRPINETSRHVTKYGTCQVKEPTALELQPSRACNCNVTPPPLAGGAGLARCEDGLASINTAPGDSQPVADDTPNAPPSRPRPTLSCCVNNKSQADNRSDSPLHTSSLPNVSSATGVKCTACGASLNNDHETSGVGGGVGNDDKKPDRPKSALERASNRVPCLGILLSLGASIFLGTAGMLVKMTRSVHGIQVAVIRAIIQLVIYALIIKLRNLTMLPKRGEWAPVGARAMLGGMSITFSYCALKLIPLGDATTIRFSLPIWTLIVSYFFLHESCSFAKISAVFVCIVGVVLIAKPDDCVYVGHLFLASLGLESRAEFEIHATEYEQARKQAPAAPTIVVDEGGAQFEQQNNDNNTLFSDQSSSLQAEVVVLSATAAAAAADQSTEYETGFDAYQTGLLNYVNMQQLQGCSLALASSICLSLSLIALRLCKRTQAEITILWLSICSIGVGSATLVAIHEWRMPDNWLDVTYIGLNGLCGAIGQWFITSALKIEQSGIISLARTFDIEVAFLYSAFLLREQIRITSVVGSVLVSLGVIIVVLPKWWNDRKTTTSTASESSAVAIEPQLQRVADDHRLNMTSGVKHPTEYKAAE